MNDYCLAGTRNERWSFEEPHVVEGDFDGSKWWRVFARRQGDGKFTCGTGSTRQEAIDACKRNIDNFGAIDGLTVPFVDYVRAQQQWSQRTFGPGTREKGVIDHITKELKEIANAAPSDKLSEWIDIIILGIDGAWRTGATPEQVAEALAAKQAKNFARVWPDWRTMSEDQAIEHDRTADPTETKEAWDYPYLCQRCGVKQWAQPRSECHNCGFTLVENHASPSQT